MSAHQSLTPYGRPISRRALLVAFGAGAVAAPHGSFAQQARKAARIGFLANSDAASLATYTGALRQGLRELGYLEGRTVAIQYRYAEGRLERLPDLAAELARLEMDVIVTEGTSATLAAKNATRTVPIVMGLVGDPVGSGLVDSLARPGGNITGLTTQSHELVGKHLELLKEIVPGLARVAVLWNPAHPAQPLALPGIRIAARTLGLELQLVEARTVDELDKAFSELARTRPGALAAVSDTMLDGQQRRLAELAARSKLPAAYTKADFVEAGGLISYGARFSDLFRRASVYVDKILKGEKPANLPVEQPTNFELILNLKAAKLLGLTVPALLLARADQVIE
jgi:putative ABC transport system substrate-binding protein